MRDLLKINSFLFFLLCYNIGFSCDICSCGAANNSQVSDGGNTNYVGLSYNYMHFTYKEGIATKSPTANDYIHTATVLGQYFVTDKIQLNVTIPYRLNRREATTGTVKNNGIGDATIYGLYQLLSKTSSHSLKIGGGVKLPTGAFNLQRANDNQTSAMQLGTGSLDVLLPIQYKYKAGKLSFAANGTYFIKNENSDSFKYGNQTQLAANISYNITLKKGNLLVPIVGVNHDVFKATERFEVVDKRTSGTLTNASFGVKAVLNTMVVGLNYQLPIHQHLIDGEVNFKKGMGMYAFYRF